MYDKKNECLFILKFTNFRVFFHQLSAFLMCIQDNKKIISSMMKIIKCFILMAERKLIKK